MKRIFLLLAVVAMTAFQSCEGDPGPAGPPGADGLIAEVFEVTTNFVPTADPETSYRSFFDLNPAIFTSDVVLVYELSGVFDGNDIWKPLPQTYTFDNGGILLYNFDFTVNDFSIFMDANFDRSTLDATWTQNRTFRIVIIPGEFSNIIDVNNYNAVSETFGLENSEIKTLHPRN